MEEEQKIMAARGFPSKPEFEDFNVAEEIGHGNYSRVVRATHISSGVTYAIKEISKSHIARLSKRHPNVKNEILIEKRSLFKLDHPNIVKLHTTFQVSMRLMTGKFLCNKHWSRPPPIYSLCKSTSTEQSCGI